jgi:hypothetical protein
VDDILIAYDQEKTNEQVILQRINGIDNNLQFKMATEVNNTINYLDILIPRNIMDRDRNSNPLQIKSPP